MVSVFQKLLLLAFSSGIWFRPYLKHIEVPQCAHHSALMHSRLEQATPSIGHMQIPVFLSGVQIKVLANSTPLADTHTLADATVHCDFAHCNHCFYYRYPVAIVEDLEPNEPTRVELLGEALALWRDKDEQWRAVVDRCPHRWAPLSEGLIDPVTKRLTVSSST
jgi:Rieske [2Fe-2S] domain